MLKKIREKLYIDTRIKVPVEELYSEITRIREKSNIIMLTPLPTDNSWRGIYNGAIAFCPDNLLAIPQLFSKPVYSDEEFMQICIKMLQLKYERIIYSGYPAYFKKLILNIHSLKLKHNIPVDQYLIYHGSFASNAEDDTTTVLLKEILQLNLDGYIKRIGFIKKGMSETLAKVCGLSSAHLIPMTLPIGDDIKKQTAPLPGINIGVLTHNQYRKNLHNQVAAALMVDNAKVHIRNEGDFDYLLNKEKLERHNFISSYEGMLKFTGSMTINFYVTFSECFGLFITESLSLGVPCLAADNSGLFDYDEDLKNLLIVREFDDSNAIYKHAIRVLENREDIGKRGIEYVNIINKIANEKFQDFLK